ncbi:NAD(P)-binding protein [Patellaria atrata CBS 101060]|uniref:NAD(P)-binding protein n=1 Tax=Patellaria atrata CBS 101060 TaxID=1346257 RepID=A0A9P4SC78_9PEZI|nr:NAD(P)-binding protein [Patellaria atrata CBS 101060]
MSTPWTFVSPASRGIGLAIARKVLRTTNAPLVATARRDLDKTKNEILRGLEGEAWDKAEKRVRVENVDVLDEEIISKTCSDLSQIFPKVSHHLHLSFILPGVLFPERSPKQIHQDDVLMTLRTNVLGPLLLLKHLSPLLPTKSTSISATPQSTELYAGLASPATLALMSARVGSISDNRLGGWYSYRASKAALNQVIKTFDNHLRGMAGDKAMAMGLHPGTVRTGLSQEFWGNVKEEKLFEPEWVAERLVGLVCGGLGGLGLDKGIGLDGRGRVWDWKGEEVPP